MHLRSFPSFSNWRLCQLYSRKYMKVNGIVKLVYKWNITHHYNKKLTLNYFFEKVFQNLYIKFPLFVYFQEPEKPQASPWAKSSPLHKYKNDQPYFSIPWMTFSCLYILFSNHILPNFLNILMNCNP